MNKLVKLNKLQGVIRNPFAFYYPIQRGFSGSIQTLASKMAHAKPIQALIVFALVFGKPLSKHPSEYLDTFVVIRKNMSEAVMSPDGKFMWNGSEWIPSPPSEVVEASPDVQHSSKKKDWKREEKIESLLKISDMQADIDEIEERVGKFNPILSFTLIITISLFVISLLGFDELSRAAQEMAICGFFIWLLLAGFVEYTMTNKIESLNKKIRFERKWHRDKS